MLRSRQPTRDEPTSTSYNYDNSGLYPDLREDESFDDEEFDAETQNVVDAWEKSQELGSANAAFESPPEPRSDKEMFPVSQSEVEE